MTSKRTQQITTIALDLEGTLIKDQLEPIPRPGLYQFVEGLHRAEFRIVMMTTVPELTTRNILQDLVEQGACPEWFADVEYVNWNRPCKDLQSIPRADLESCCLIDDYEGYVCLHQKKQWISIDTFFEQGDRDKELERISREILLFAGSKPA